MKFDRLHTTADRPVADQLEWKTVHAKIAEPDGSIVFEADVEVPAAWGERAANVFAQKYLRKAGVPADPRHIINSGRYPANLPEWLYPSRGVYDAVLGAETSARQVFHRMSGAWTYWGWRSGHLTTDEDARAFYDEAYAMLAAGVAAPNSPQFFNTGLHWAYGIEGPANGQWYCDDQGEPHLTQNSYERPQPHACFLSTVTDDLVNEGGIMDLWVREARIFKHGSGSGVNISSVRGKNERLGGGGVASGAMSFVEVGDRSAGSIASGGTTRRAAKLLIMNADHPEIEDFIGWKVREEAKAAAIAVGSTVMRDRLLNGTSLVGIPQAIIDRAKAGILPEEYDVNWEGEAIRTVSGQNSNNSVRVTDKFVELSARDPSTLNWALTARTTGETVREVNASELWGKICTAAWASADPGLLFHDTINAWNTCSMDGVINTSNPCAEFHHLDGSACNLASLRLTAFLNADGSIDLDRFEHACRLWTVVLDISVSMAAFPAKEFALGAWKYRTLGLGYMDLGRLLVLKDLRYDSDEARSLAAGLTSLMTGISYQTSAEMADELGPFPRWEANAEPMRRVLRNHEHATHSNARQDGFEGLNVLPQLFTTARPILARIRTAWDAALAAKSFRNAQVTLVAPTGTISIVAGCDTSGIEPYYARTSTKSLAGGGQFEMAYEVPDEDCVISSSPFGPCLAPLAHVKMVAAVQPFLSGAVSKTINLPRSASVEDVSMIYREAHRLGLKAVALYRDGSKLTQPLNASTDAKQDDASLDALPGRTGSRHGQDPDDKRNSVSLSSVVRFGKKSDSAPRDRGQREYLPWRRSHPSDFTQKVKIGDHGMSLWFKVNHYPDGRPGEVFIELAHEGSTLRAAFNLVAMMVSVGLQHGVPIRAFADRLIDTKFEPAGIVEGHERLKVVQSIGDYIGRELAITYLGEDELGQVVPVGPAAAEELAREVVAMIDKRALGVARGYTGDVCSRCHNATMKRAGSCLCCDTCGETTGCG